MIIDTNSMANKTDEEDGSTRMGKRKPVTREALRYAGRSAEPPALPEKPLYTSLSDFYQSLDLSSQLVAPKAILISVLL
jgi:hypothetical protein